jgi:hypothetical protein
MKHKTSFALPSHLQPFKFLRSREVGEKNWDYHFFTNDEEEFNHSVELLNQIIGRVQDDGDKVNKTNILKSLRVIYGSEFQFSFGEPTTKELNHQNHVETVEEKLLKQINNLSFTQDLTNNKKNIEALNKIRKLLWVN